MSLNDILSEDAAAIVDTEFLGEAAVYTKASGATRNINVVVVRDGLVIPAEITRGVAPQLIVLARNSSTRGISSSELDPNKDTITVAARIGGTTKAYPLSPPVAQNAGLLTFNLGKP